MVANDHVPLGQPRAYVSHHGRCIAELRCCFPRPVADASLCAEERGGLSSDVASSLEFWGLVKGARASWMLLSWIMSLFIVVSTRRCRGRDGAPRCWSCSCVGLWSWWSDAEVSVSVLLLQMARVCSANDATVDGASSDCPMSSTGRSCGGAKVTLLYYLSVAAVQRVD